MESTNTGRYGGLSGATLQGLPRDASRLILSRLPPSDTARLQRVSRYVANLTVGDLIRVCSSPLSIQELGRVLETVTLPFAFRIVNTRIDSGKQTVSNLIVVPEDVEEDRDEWVVHRETALEGVLDDPDHESPDYDTRIELAPDSLVQVLTSHRPSCARVAPTLPRDLAREYTVTSLAAILASNFPDLPPTTAATFLQDGSHPFPDTLDLVIPEGALDVPPRTHDRLTIVYNLNKTLRRVQHTVDWLTVRPHTEYTPLDANSSMLTIRTLYSLRLRGDLNRVLALYHRLSV